ncbi:MAG: insulinase family protein [Sphingomonadales bacterium]|nr:insulinase family protein [Sphingomonadales bacterium]
MNFRSTAPEAKTIKELSFVAPKEFTLSGGQSLFTSPKRDLGVIKLLFYWPYGTAHQSVPMLARATQTLRLSGNKNLSAEEIQEGFEYWGAAANLDVGLLSSTLVLQIQKQHLEQSLKWLMEQGAEPVFPEEELMVFKQVEVASLLRRMQTPRYWSSRLCFETLYGKDSADTRFANPKDIENLKATDLKNWFEKHLPFSGAKLFASGDFGDDERKAVERLVGTASALETPPALALPQNPEFNSNIRHNMDHAQQVSLYMGKALPRLTIHEMQTASFVNMFLGGFFGSRLMQDLRETRGLTYGIGSGLTPSAHGFTWYISGEMNSQNAEKAAEATRKIMLGLAGNPPVGEELEKARRCASGQLRAGFDGPFSLPAKWQFLMQNNLPESYYATYMDRIWSITSDEISEFADNYLHPDSFTLALAGKLS